MASSYHALSYHGRRSVDELISALNAKTVAAALAHRQLSLLHFERFVENTSSDANADDAFGFSSGTVKSRIGRALGATKIG